ncbi:MAG: hypothetical protein ABIR63_07975 [Sphingomicrobium sp.]
MLVESKTAARKPERDHQLQVREIAKIKLLIADGIREQRAEIEESATEDSWTLRQQYYSRSPSAMRGRLPTKRKKS